MSAGRVVGSRWLSAARASGSPSAGSRRSGSFLIIASGWVTLLVAGTVGAARLQGDPNVDPSAIALVVAAAIATAGLRRAPFGALATVMTAVSGYLVAGYPYGPVQLCMVVAMFEVARRRPLPRSAVACGLAALAASAAMPLRPMPAPHQPLLLALAWTGWVVLPWSLGALLHVTATARERARRDLVTRAAAAERERIAAEVHDVAGHGFALVAMHAGIALLVLDERPDQARASLEAIKATGDASLAGLRSLLDACPPPDLPGFLAPPPPDLPGSLAPSAPDPPGSGTCSPADRRSGSFASRDRRGRRPKSGALPSADDRAVLASLGALIDEVRAAGLPVSLTAAEVPLTGEAAAVAYRVVRESLTNILRHAGPTSAGVHVEIVDDRDVLIRVTDRGSGGVAAGGRGLTGLRRRVEAAGGRFAAGPQAGGGFQVTAWLPVGGAG